MTTEEIAWAAGIFDGEGCIHIRRNAVTETSRHRTTHYALITKVTMCHAPTIERLHRIFGVGHVGLQKGSARKSPSASWYCMSKDAAFVLHHLKPFLFTKLEEAELGIAFSELPTARNGRVRVPDDLLDRREQFYLALRNIKSVSKYYNH
jgi:hypothetical protein